MNLLVITPIMFSIAITAFENEPYPIVALSGNEWNIYPVAYDASTVSHEILVSYLHFATEDRWDGGTAIAVSRDCINHAARLLAAIAPTSILPDITPTVSGGISFLWEDDNSELYLEVRPDGSTHLYCNVAGVPQWEGVRPANDSDIKRRIKQAFSVFDSKFVTYSGFNTFNITNEKISAVTA